jgi:hypothetical protein
LTDVPVTATVEVYTGDDIHVGSLAPNREKAKLPVGFVDPPKLTLANT